ncbi:MAG: DUF4388 domain-containing protein, partial [Nitrospirae bacterium]|nr:DUF4388 domain-containing protein [Nitrospirota bacterium]
MMVKDHKERRRFLRYEKNRDVSIKTGKGSCSARLLNYSPFGVKIQCSEFLELYKPVNVLSDSISEAGHIVWVRGDLAGIEFGGRYVGGMGDYSLSDLLIGLKFSQKTGLLKISSRGLETTICIRAGDPIFARSNAGEAGVGSFLLRTGKIGADTYSRVTASVKKSGKPEGALLVELGFIKPQELFLAVRLQAEDVIRNAFRMTDGTFEFMEGSLPPDDVIPLRMSIASLIYRGIKGIDSSEYLKGVLPEPGNVLMLSPDPVHLFQDIELDEKDAEILRMINGVNSINDIMRQSPIDTLDTLKAIHAFLSTRIADIKTGETGGAQSAEDILGGRDQVDGEFMSEVKALYEKCEDMDYYEMLGVGRDASHQEIKRAYYGKVKQYHPDRYFRIQMDDLKNS